MSRRRRISFILPFVDFAFMVIIIFLGMLSIAVFETPGTPPKVVVVQPLESNKEQSPKKEGNVQRAPISRGLYTFRRREKSAPALTAPVPPKALWQKSGTEGEQGRGKARGKGLPQPTKASQGGDYLLPEWHAYLDLRKGE